VGKDNRRMREKMVEEVVLPETSGESEDAEMLIFAVLVIVSIVLGYRNRTKIKKWFDDVIGNFK